MKGFKKWTAALLVVAAMAPALIGSASAAPLACGAGTVSATALNVRSGAGTTHPVKTTIRQGDPVVVLDVVDDTWYRVNCNGVEGYVASRYISGYGAAKNFSAQGRVAGSGVRMRGAPNTSSAILGVYQSGHTMRVIGLNNGWYKVEDGGKTGYIRSDLMDITGPGTAPAAAATPLAQQIADYACQYVGYRYVYGAASPSTGFDCSGLTSYVYGRFNTPISRTAAQQFINNGVSVSKANLRPGDLVFFSSNGGRSVTHVGLYIGDGRFVHASTSATGVIISSLSSAYYTNVWYGAKRIVS